MTAIAENLQDNGQGAPYLANKNTFLKKQDLVQRLLVQSSNTNVFKDITLANHILLSASNPEGGQFS